MIASCGPREIHHQYDQICLFVPTIYSPIQVADDVVHKLDQLGFERPLTTETILTVTASMLSETNSNINGFATDACERHRYYKTDGFEMTRISKRTSESGAVSIMFEQVSHRFI